MGRNWGVVRGGAQALSLCAVRLWSRKLLGAGWDLPKGAFQCRQPLGAGARCADGMRNGPRLLSSGNEWTVAGRQTSLAEPGCSPGLRFLLCSLLALSNLNSSTRLALLQGGAEIFLLEPSLKGSIFLLKLEVRFLNSCFHPPIHPSTPPTHSSIHPINIYLVPAVCQALFSALGTQQ